MNPPNTSKEEILRACRKIVSEQGLPALRVMPQNMWTSPDANILQYSVCAAVAADNRADIQKRLSE